MSRFRSLGATIAAVAIVAVLLLSAFGSFGNASPTSPTRVVQAVATTPLVGTATITPSDAFGFRQTSFDVGYSNGNVYFVATDTAGDLSAYVAINDQNATRDHLTNPVDIWNVSFAHSTTNSSGTWGAHRLLPLTLVDGGWWNVTISASLGGFHSASFYVHTYSVEVAAQSPVVLPAHNVVLIYQVVSSANDAPYPSVTSIQVAGMYTEKNFSTASWFGTTSRSATAAPWGSFTAPMPTDVANDTVLSIEVWANVTTTGINTTEKAHVNVEVGSLPPGSVSLVLGSCATGCPSTSFGAGTLAYLSINALIEGSGATVPAASLLAKVDFVGLSSSGLGSIGSPPTQLTLNATGQAGIVFNVSTSAFAPYSTHTINVTVYDPSVTNTTNTTSVQFEVVPQAIAAPTLVVSFAQNVYHSGDTATVSWALGGVNATVTQGWTVNAWYAYEADGTDGPLVAWSNISSTALSGTFTVAVPANYSGPLTAYVEAFNASGDIWSDDVVAILSPTIDLTPSEVDYQPGDTITVNVVTEGGALTGATLFAEVYGGGYVFQDGSLSGSTITVQVPKVATPSTINFEVTAESSTRGVLTSQLLTVYEANSYQLLVSVSTSSKYTDGSFQPGQTVTVQYHLVAFGLAQLPTLISLGITAAYFEGDQQSYGGATMYDSVPVSGSISYTLPSALPSGAEPFVVDAVFPSAAVGCPGPGGEGFDPGLCGYSSIFTLTVNPNPSVLEYQLVPNSDLTLGWLILLVLIVVVALVLWLRGRQAGKRPMTMSPEPSAPSNPGNVPPAAVSGSGPAAWQGPAGGPGSGGPTVAVASGPG